MPDAYPPRSWLFVPGDSVRKSERSIASGADAVILDLEDSVAPAAKADARLHTLNFIKSRRTSVGGPQLWVRVNPLDTPESVDDVAAAVEAGAYGLVLPKAEGADDVVRLARMIDTIDANSAAHIMAIATETPRAVLRLQSFAEMQVPRLSALTWGAEDLATAIGATGNRHADGNFHDAFRSARSLALFAANAAGVQAVDTLFADFRDDAGLMASSSTSRREGFTGRLAIHPAQVATINAAFSPTADEIVHAERVVAAFAAIGAAGTVGIDGKMVDRPHLLQAQALLARHAAFAH